MELDNYELQHSPRSPINQEPDDSDPRAVDPEYLNISDRLMSFFNGDWLQTVVVEIDHVRKEIYFEDIDLNYWVDTFENIHNLKLYRYENKNPD